MWNNHENARHNVAPTKKAVNTKYSSQPFGKSPSAVLGLRYTINIATMTRIKPTKCVHMFPVSVWILLYKKRKKISLDSKHHSQKNDTKGLVRPTINRCLFLLYRMAKKMFFLPCINEIMVVDKPWLMICDQSHAINAFGSFVEIQWFIRR